jgi:hypothetical protein
MLKFFAAIASFSPTSAMAGVSNCRLSTLIQAAGTAAVAVTAMLLIVGHFGIKPAGAQGLSVAPEQSVGCKGQYAHGIAVSEGCSIVSMRSQVLRYSNDHEVSGWIWPVTGESHGESHIYQDYYAANLRNPERFRVLETIETCDNKRLVVSPFAAMRFEIKYAGQPAVLLATPGTSYIVTNNAINNVVTFYSFRMIMSRLYEYFDDPEYNVCY